MTWRLAWVGIQLPEGVQLPKLPEGMPDLSKLTDQLPSALTHLKVRAQRRPHPQAPSGAHGMALSCGR